MTVGIRRQPSPSRHNSPGPCRAFLRLLFERLIHSFKTFFGRRKHAAKETDKKSGEFLTVR